MKHKLTFISIHLLAFPLMAGAATITYDFEGPNGDETTITGTGVSATPLTGMVDSEGGYNPLPFPGNTNEGVSELRQGTNLATSTAISSVVGTIDGQRLDGTDPENPSADSLASYIEFTLTPRNGEALNFSAATFSLKMGAFSAVDTQSITNNTLLMYRTSSDPTWIAIDGVKSTTYNGTVVDDPVFHTLPNTTDLFQAYTLDGGEAGTGNGGLTTVNIEISSLSFASDESVTFALFMDSNVTNGNQGGVLFDDIQITNVTSSPPPTSPDLLTIDTVSLNEDRSVITLEWDSEENEIFIIDYSTDLSNWIEITDDHTATGPRTTYEHTPDPPTDSLYYRIRK